MKNLLINLSNRIKALGKRKLIFLILIILAVAVALPLTIIQVQQQQNTKQRAEVGEMFTLVSITTVNGNSLQDNLTLKNNTGKDVTAIDMEISYPPDLNGLINFQPGSTVVILANKTSDRIKFTAINPTDHPLTGDISIGTLTIDVSSLKDVNKIKKIMEIKVLSTIAYHNPDDTNQFATSSLITDNDLAGLISQLAPAPISADQIKCSGSPTVIESRTIGTFSISGIVCDQNKNPKNGIDVILGGHALNGVKTDANGSYSFPNLKPSNYNVNAGAISSTLQNLTGNARIDLVIPNAVSNTPTSIPATSAPAVTTQPTTPTNTPAPTSIPPTPTSSKFSTGTICYYGAQCESGFCDYDQSGTAYGHCR